MNIELHGENEYISPPNVCPYCHITISPIYQSDFSSRNIVDTANAFIVWLCTNQICQRIFITEYLLDIHQYKFHRNLNGLPKGPNWPQPIQDLKDGKTLSDPEPAKSKFIKTYLQALVAENAGLDEIAGMGYRKSIEYLVKDWAIQTAPADIDKIDKMSLAQNISTYFTGDLKDILSRATWLGNDHAHYSKLFEDYDLEHIKELIALIMVELDRLYKLNHYITSIQPKK